MIPDAIQLPYGKLLWENDFTIKIFLPEVSRSFIFERQISNLRPLKDSDWLVPQLETIGSKICLVYKSPCHLTPLNSVREIWEQNPQKGVADCFQLSKCLKSAMANDVLFGKIELLPPSPATVFIMADNTGRMSYKFAAIPAFLSSLREWANASEITWQWINKEAFANVNKININYLISAAIYYCLCGNLVPAHLPKNEQFRRFWTGRTGKIDVLKSTLQNVLPSSICDKAAYLGQQLSLSLMQNNNNNEDFGAYIATNFSTKQLAVLWKNENEPEIALELWLNLKNWFGAQDVNWADVANLYKDLYQPQKAEEAILTGIDFMQESAINGIFEYLLNEVRFSTPMAYENFNNIIQKCDVKINSVQENLYNLRVAHFYLRYYNSKEKALLRISRQYNNQWHEILSNLLLTRIYLILSPDLPKASKLCKYSISVIENQYAPSEATENALAYFHLMNAIANFHAISKFNDISYIKDAYRSFLNAIDIAITNDNKEMTNYAFDWLNWISDYIVYFPDDLRCTLQIGIAAFLELQKSRGITFNNYVGIPKIPWYPESILFS